MSAHSNGRGVESSGGPPASMAAETAILGAILLNNGHYQEAAGRIEADVTTLGAHTDQIDATIRELLFEAYSMVMGADVDAGVARIHAVGEPASQRVDEKAVFFVKLNEMRVRERVAPRDRRRK